MRWLDERTFDPTVTAGALQTVDAHRYVALMKPKGFVVVLVFILRQLIEGSSVDGKTWATPYDRLNTRRL